MQAGVDKIVYYTVGENEEFDRGLKDILATKISVSKMFKLLTEAGELFEEDSKSLSFKKLYDESPFLFRFARKKLLGDRCQMNVVKMCAKEFSIPLQETQNK